MALMETIYDVLHEVVRRSALFSHDEINKAREIIDNAATRLDSYVQEEAQKVDDQIPTGGPTV